MTWVNTKMKWIMLVSGILTSSMIYAAIAPQAALLSTFGVSIEGPLAEIVVRNWGALIALVGAMLIYGAFDLTSRPLVLTVATISKLIFVALVLIYGQQYLGYQAGFAIVIDMIMIPIFIGYLINMRKLSR